MLSWCFGVEGRIREEELTTVSTTSFTVTWVTKRELDSQLSVVPCDAEMAALQQARADQWTKRYLDALNDNSELFATLVGLQQQGATKNEEIQALLRANVAWVTSYLFGHSTAPEEPAAAPEEPAIAELLASRGQIIVDPTPTMFHYLTVNGLQPGTTYCYQAMSGDEVGSPTLWSPGHFTTLTPPPGEHLFTFATVNDMHVGEDVAGLIVIGGIVLTPGFTWDDPNNPYWKFTNEAAVSGINTHNVDFTVAKGDVSSDFKEEEYLEVQRILGNLNQPYYIMRGNHDRVGYNGPDYYKQVFGLNTTWYSWSHQGFHFVALDSVKLDDGQPHISEEQFVFLEKDLAAHADNKTFVFLHHAITLEAFIWSIPLEDRSRFIAILERNPQVVGVFSGHSHRASLTHDLTLKEMIFSETPSTKEYPMGYCIYQVYSGGYIQNFHRSRCAECLEWNSMTRQEFFRLSPFFTFGTLADKNFVVSF